MRRPLSSELTFFWKVIFPTLWLGGFGTGIVFVLAQADMGGGVNSNGPSGIICVLPVALLGGAFILYVWCMRLKSVSMDDEALYVSNYLKQVRIPLTDVRKVEQHCIPNTHPIEITFNRPTPFGGSIVFMGRMGLFDWRDIDQVQLIREATAAARLAASAPADVSPHAGSSKAITTAPAASSRTEITNRGPGDIRKEGGERG